MARAGVGLGGDRDPVIALSRGWGGRKPANLCLRPTQAGSRDPPSPWPFGVCGPSELGLGASWTCVSVSLLNGTRGRSTSHAPSLHGCSFAPHEARRSRGAPPVCGGPQPLLARASTLPPAPHVLSCSGHLSQRGGHRRAASLPSCWAPGVRTAGRAHTGSLALSLPLHGRGNRGRRSSGLHGDPRRRLPVSRTRGGHGNRSDLSPNSLG